MVRRRSKRTISEEQLLHKAKVIPATNHAKTSRNEAFSLDKVSLNQRTVLAVQRKLGNAAARQMLSAKLQREEELAGAASSRKTFRSTDPDYGSEPKLVACLNNEDRLRPGDTGSAVMKIQIGLQKDGMDLGADGTSGVYGMATAKAVMAFKHKHNLGSTQFPDVGPGTTRKLDELSSSGPAPAPVPTPSSVDADMAVINRADRERLSALAKAIAAITVLEELKSEVPDENDPVVKAFRRNMFTHLDSNFFPTVERAKNAMMINLITRSPFKIDKACRDFAHVDGSVDPGLGVTFCGPFFEADDTCRREVITHEFFHFIVGAQHHYDATTTEEALNCPHHLAELVFEIATGEVGGCGNGSKCF